MGNKEKVMKKFLIGCATAAMIMAPAAVKAGNDWIGPAIAGTVFGIIIGSNSHGHNNQAVIVQERRGHRYHRRHHRPRYTRRHHRPPYRWVEVCDRVGYVERRRRHGRHTNYRVECYMVRKAVW